MKNELKDYKMRKRIAKSFDILLGLVAGIVFSGCLYQIIELLRRGK